MTSTQKNTPNYSPNYARIIPRDLELAQAFVANAPDEKRRMEERLYRAVLTVMSLPNGAPKSGSSWPFVVRDWGDALGRLQAGPGEELIDVQRRLEADTKRPRYQPSARDLSEWMGTLDLLAGFTTAGAHGAADRLEQAGLALQALQRKRAAIAEGRQPCAAERIKTVLAKLDSDIARAVHHCEAMKTLAKPHKGVVRQAQGTLKGAAHWWWLGSPRRGLSRWDYAASFAGMECPKAARRLHDNAVLWAVVAEQRRRDQGARG